MTNQELEAESERYASPATTYEDAAALLARVPARDFAAFFARTQVALDRVAKATRPESAPRWIGAGHALADPLVRSKLERLEQEAKSRRGG